MRKVKTLGTVDVGLEGIEWLQEGRGSLKSSALSLITQSAAEMHLSESIAIL